MRKFLSTWLIVLASSTMAVAETVRFTASDGVEVTADFNKPAGAYSTVLVLFHMAGASRGEYRDIATRLNQMGYGTLAVDQRSGGAFNGVKNETVAHAGGSTGYLDAIPDLLAASDWARRSSGATNVGALGSSYSAGLVLVLAAREPGFADAVMSFSPGEYYGSADYVSQELSSIQVPVFLTSAHNETGQWKPFEEQIKSPVTGFIPQGNGRHGASSLVSDDQEEYWVALTRFLEVHLPAR